MFRTAAVWVAKRNDEKPLYGAEDLSPGDTVTVKAEDILSMQDVDPSLNAKMYLVNNVRTFTVAMPFALHDTNCSSGN